MSRVVRSPRFLSFARPYVRWRLARAFDGVWTSGLEEARARVAREPLIVAANHVAWWDPLLLVWLDQALGGESVALMDAANLRRLPFMALVGAIGLDRSGGGSSLGGLRTATAWLDRPGRVVFVFPQGRQRPSQVRPLGFARGVEWLARRSRARVLPLSIAYGFRESHRPAAGLVLGPPCAPDVAHLEAAVAGGLERLDRFYDGLPEAALQPGIPAPTARSDEGLGARLLGHLTRRA